MKNFTSFQSINEVKRAVMTNIIPMLFVAFGLFGVNENAWGGKPYAKVIVNSDPTKGGYVYVGGGTGGNVATAASKN